MSLLDLNQACFESLPFSRTLAKAGYEFSHGIIFAADFREFKMAVSTVCEGRPDLNKILPGIIQFQALYKGYRTRKALEVLKESFVQIGKDLQGENFEKAVGLLWKPCLTICQINALFYPKFYCKINTTKANIIKQPLVVEESPYQVGQTIPEQVAHQNRDGDEVDIKKVKKHKESVKPIDKTVISPRLVPVEEATYQNENDGFEINSRTGEADKVADEEQKEAISIVWPTVCIPAEERVNSVKCRTLEQTGNPENVLSSDELRETSVQEATNDQTDEHERSLLEHLHISSHNKSSLESVQNELKMELIWVQQAIDSRKQYLRLKKKKM